MKLSENAITLLKKRYLLMDDKGRSIETPEGMFRRVAKAVAGNKKEEREFYLMMSRLDFLPNSPTLMNAGTEIGQLAACFVLPIDDSIESIFDTMKKAALIHQSGGGTGFNFSKLRPKGDMIARSHGQTSGPCSFIELYDKASDIMKSGGKRRGANMGILNVEHPDIMEFIRLKQEKKIENFNLSVAVTDKFMQAVIKGKSFELINPRTKKTARKIRAREIFDAIVECAWKTGDPGIIFIDEVNRKNMLKLGRIEASNPCGEAMLYDYESCNLGSINLSNMVDNGMVDFEKLRRTVRTAVKLLDNVIDANKYPLKEVEEATRANRKTGLGVMGFADMLIKLGIAYDSEEAVKAAEEIMKFIDEESKKASAGIASENGAFPNFKYSKYNYRIRNATTTTIAPTGSLSIIADTSSGIEPLFALRYEKKVLGGSMRGYNRAYEEMLRKHKGSIPENVMRLFRTAHEIRPEQHVRIQAAFQRHTDNAVSKTINMPSTATREDVEKAFIAAYRSGCKGITAYREGSKAECVICEVK